MLGLLHRGLATLDVPVLVRLIDAWRTRRPARASTPGTLAVAVPPDARDARRGAAAGRRAGPRAETLRSACATPGLAKAARRHAAAMFALGGGALRRFRRRRRAGRLCFAWAEAQVGAAHAADAARPERAGSGCSRRPATRSRRGRRTRCALGDDELAATAPGQAMASALHETQYCAAVPVMRTSMKHKQPLRVGVAGPVGSGKTALVDALCKRLRDQLRHRRRHQRHLHPGGRAVPDAQRGAARRAHRRRRDRRLPAHGDPRRRVDQPRRHRQPVAQFPELDLVIVESGGDNLAATFSPELADLRIYVIDVAGGDKIPRKGGPGITKSDLLVINKIDLAPHVGASLEVMDRDARKHARRAALRLHQHPPGRRRRSGRRLRGPRRHAGRVAPARTAAEPRARLPRKGCRFKTARRLATTCCWVRLATETATTGSPNCRFFKRHARTPRRLVWPGAQVDGIDRTSR